jgi:hypothetical protein
MAQAQGVSKNTVNRLWQLHNLKPHRTKTFKLSRDPQFIEKLTDVVGLYLNPPDKAIVLCLDEKNQIQALDRTQPGLPATRQPAHMSIPITARSVRDVQVFLRPSWLAESSFTVTRPPVDRAKCRV